MNASSQQLKRKGSIGISMHNILPDSLVQKLNLQGIKGVLVKQVFPNTTAAQIGLQENDFINTINNKVISSALELYQYAIKVRDGEAIAINLIRNKQQLTLEGKIVAKPIDNSEVANVTYSAFLYKNQYIRTILRQPKNKEAQATIYFIQGIPCYSLDNMKPLDPTRQALDALAENGFNVYIVEKQGMGDNNDDIPCSSLGFNDEVALFIAGYENLLQQPYVNKNNIIVFGHSLGGIVAPLVAEKFQPKGVIVFGTGYKPWKAYLEDAMTIQTAYYGKDTTALKNNFESYKPLWNDFFDGKKTEEDLLQSTKGTQLIESFLSYNTVTKLALSGRTLQFHKEINDNNIAYAWSNYKNNVLAAYGESDIAANNADDHIALIKAINKKNKGKGTFMLVDRTNHMFQEIGTMQDYIAMQKNPAAYEKFAETKFNKQLFVNISNWIKAIL